MLLKKVTYEKFHDAEFFSREIVDVFLQVRISKNLILHATSLSLKFSPEFILSTKCKAIFGVAIVFVIHLLSFLSLRGVLTLVSCPIVLSIYSSTSHCLKQFCESVLTFLFFHHSCCSGR